MSSVAEQLSSVSDFCPNYPSFPTLTVRRDAICEHVERLFSAGVSRVFVEGEQLSGKTLLAATLMQRHPEDTLGVFLSGESFFYNFEFVKRAVSEQLHWMINGKAIEEGPISDEVFSRLIYQAQKMARRQRITFVVDGLLVAQASERSATDEILNGLPIGFAEFNFIFTGSAALYDYIAAKTKIRSATLLPITSDEALSIFESLPVTADDIAQIRHFCGGNVGQLIKFRELIDAGHPVSTLLNEKNGTLKSLLDLEWNLIEKSDRVIDVLAIISFSDRNVSLDRLSRLLKFESNQVEELVRGLPMLLLDPEKKTIGVHFQAQRRFIQEKLANHKSRTQQLLIAELLEQPTSQDAVEMLPGQLLSASRHSDLIGYMDAAHFVRVLKTMQSLQALQSHLVMGLRSARAIGETMHEWRFAVSAAAVRDLRFTVGSSSKIKALLRMGAKDQAIALALSAHTAEERLRLLAAAARAFQASRLPVDAELLGHVRDAVDRVDFSQAEISTEAAVDLISVDFDLAMKIVQSVADAIKSSSPDKLTQPITTGQASAVHEERGMVPTVVQEKLGDQILAQFANAAVEQIENASVDQILRQVERVKEEHRPFFLQRWLDGNANHVDSWRVADQILDLLLRNVTRRPRLKDFREIAAVLPSISDLAVMERLLARIEAQRATFKDTGTTVESARLEMYLVHAHFRLSHTDAQASLEGLIGTVKAVPEVETKATCYAWLLRAVHELNLQGPSDFLKVQLKSLTQQLTETIASLLLSTADHFRVARSAIEALALHNPRAAVDLVKQLNTEQRRDDGYAYLCDVLVSTRRHIEYPGVVLDAIASIQGAEKRDAAITRTLSRIADQSVVDHKTSINTGILRLWLRTSTAWRRARCAGLAYKIQRLTGVPQEQYDRELQGMRESWETIETAWARTEIGYSITADIADCDRELAGKWLIDVFEDESRARIPSEELTASMYYTVRLAARAFSKLANSETPIDDEDFLRLCSLIQQMPEIECRMAVWCDLGIRLHFRSRPLLASHLANEFVQAELALELPNDPLVKDSVTAQASSFLALSNIALSKVLTSKIRDPISRDQARSNVCRVLLRKIPEDEPYRAQGNAEFQLDFGQVASVLEMVDTMESDVDIYEVVRDLCTSLIAPCNAQRLRRGQVRDILNSIERIVDDRLPDQRNIKHDGFKTACRAYITRTKNTLEPVKPVVWTDLFCQAKAIPNVSDRVVVTTVVGICCGSRAIADANGWFETVRQELTTIPSDFDRMDRYIWIAELIEPFDRPRSKAMLQEAMTLSNHVGNCADSQRRILDLAHHIDPKLVDQLIDIGDDDEAGRAAKEELRKRKALNDLRKELGDTPDRAAFEKSSDEEVANICWQNLGALAAGRILPRRLHDFDRLQQLAERLPIRWGFAIWSWIIENSARKAGEKIGTETLLKNAFLAGCDASDLLLALAGRSGIRVPHSDDLTVFLGGDKTAVFERVQNWVIEQGNRQIRISDPFFGPEALDLIRVIANVNPSAQVRVLTGKKHIRDSVASNDAEEAFQEAWRSLSESTPPDTEIVVIGYGVHGIHPIHDRWIFTETGGIRLGSSVNAIGSVRLSEMSLMTAEECSEKCKEVDALLNRQVSAWDGERLSHNSFFLGS